MFFPSGGIFLSSGVSHELGLVAASGVFIGCHCVGAGDDGECGGCFVGSSDS